MQWFYILSNLEKCGVRNLFLHNHSDGGKHGKSAIVQFLVRHFLETLSVLWLETERIKFQITRVVVVVKLREPRFPLEIFFFLQRQVLVLGVGGELPSDQGSADFTRRNRHAQPM